MFQLAESNGTATSIFSSSARGPARDDLFELGARVRSLSDEIPAEVHVAVPEGSHRPTIDYPPTRVHVFRAATFGLGRLRVKLEDGEQFSISDRERTVVDAFRLRHLIGEDLAHAGTSALSVVASETCRASQNCRERCVFGLRCRTRSRVLQE